MRAHFGGDPGAIEEIPEGGNNRLLRLGVDDQNLLAKFYRPDKRLRMEREFEALSLLRPLGLSVPQAFFKNDAEQFAVYSLEPGHTKPVGELSQTEAEQLDNFVLALYELPPAGLHWSLPRARWECRAFKGYTDIIHERMDTFQRALGSSETDARVVELGRQMRLGAVVGELVQQATAGIRPEQLAQELPENYLRLTPVDFGAHNALFDGSRMTIVDFEYTCVDDPLRTLAEFVNHQVTRDMDPQLRRHVVDYFLSQTTLPLPVLERWPVCDRLMAIIWLTTQIVRLVPERIAGLEFADPAFDLDAHIVQTIANTRERLAELTAG